MALGFLPSYFSCVEHKKPVAKKQEKGTKNLLAVVRGRRKEVKQNLQVIVAALLEPEPTEERTCASS